MNITLLDAHDATWTATVDRLYARLGFPTNPTLFPPHFTQVVLPKLGGRIALLRDQTAEQATERGVGFLFPRQYQDGAVSYTLRFHPLAEDASRELNERLPALRAQLHGAAVVVYDPRAEHAYAPTHEPVGALDIGHPSQAETESIRRNHQSIWGSPPEFLYPTDIHSVDFQLGTSLVARLEGEVAGFLFGFYKVGGAPLPSDWQTQFGGAWRLESQAMGVLPKHRGQHVGYLLKWKQAERARRAGIGIVNWTVDPLQYPNAALNFGLLRGIAFDHYTDLYPFRNELNQVPASRFGITWLVDTERVRQLPTTGVRAHVLDLNEHPQVPRIPYGEHASAASAAARLAVEIPADWTALQRNDLAAAQRWRQETDQFFARYLGCADGQYVITGVGVDGERRYLIAERADDALWVRLAA